MSKTIKCYEELKVGSLYELANYVRPICLYTSIADFNTYAVERLAKQNEVFHVLEKYEKSTLKHHGNQRGIFKALMSNGLIRFVGFYPDEIRQAQ